MRLILNLFAVCLTLIGLSACSGGNDTQPPATLNKKVNTVKVIDQPVSIQRQNKPVKPLNQKLPCTPVQLQLPKKRTVYTNLNGILKTRS
ncbi:hypothetical protein [Lactobacillus ultunensis]|uniref:hypothetical protein n=1 Tax=Lactobacillus ultunensis TaxID=227945 RepID=UPI00058F970B|nr:hypothetical protein [Lactobacillus ultunensis]QQP27773.1 hypothetical protein H4B44_06455 [Lactobacillus ultunensis]